MALRDHAVVKRFLTFARNSPWLMIAIGLHVILAATMSVLYLHQDRRKRADAAVTIAVAPHAPPEAPALPEVPLVRDKIPDLDAPAELVSVEDTPFVPTEEIPPDVDWHESPGDPTATGDMDAFSGGNSSIGAGFGAVRGEGGPSPWGGRGKGTLIGDRPRGHPVVGVPQVTEEAVLEGLRWLMRHQEEDGSWSARTLHTHCTEPACIPDDPALDSTFDVGMTALALLAFLGQGIGPGSKVELTDEAMGLPPRSAGELVKRGIRWLMDRQKPDGSFSDSPAFALPENDTLPTMALCEAWALAPSNRPIKQQAQRALDFLVAAQKRAPDGAPWGWGVGSQAELDAQRARGALDDEAWAEESARVDLSITCWVVMALKSAQSCGLAVPDASLAGALAYVTAATAADAPAPPPEAGDRFDTHPARRAALGMLVRTFAGGTIDDPYLEQAARELAADVPRVSRDQLSVDFYYWYFATLALDQYDGPDSPRRGPHRGELWEPWNKALVGALPGLQDRTRRPDLCARGGWLQAARGNRRGRALYNTALNVLTLEVYYRFENVFGSAARDSDRRGR